MTHAISATSPYKTINCSINDQVATLTLNRPDKRNAIDQVMRTELAHAVTAIRQDRSIKILVLRGAGGAFCSGGDILSMTSDTQADAARDRMISLQGIIRDLHTLDRPIIAAIDGAAYGAGFGLALTADLIIASPRARFCLSFLRLGAVPDCGVFYALPRLTGLNIAKQLAFSTREFDATEARDMGIVSEIYPADKLHSQAAAMAKQLAQLPLAALSITKKAFNASLDSNLDTMLEMEALGQGISRSTEFHQHAIERFKQKLPLSFNNLLSEAVSTQ